MASEEAPIAGILDDLKGSGRENAVSLGEVLQTFQHRSPGALLTVFGLIAALPVIGGIPGVSILTGTLILIAVGQSMLGGGSLWLPDFLRRREVGREGFERGIAAARPWLGWMDGVVRPRLSPLIAGRIKRLLVPTAAALLAVGFYVLAFVPYGVTAPALGVMALGLGLMTGDGLLILAGYALSAVTVYVLTAAL